LSGRGSVLTDPRLKSVSTSFRSSVPLCGVEINKTSRSMGESKPEGQQLARLGCDAPGLDQLKSASRNTTITPSWQSASEAAKRFGGQEIKRRRGGNLRSQECANFFPSYAEVQSAHDASRYFADTDADRISIQPEQSGAAVGLLVSPWWTRAMTADGMSFGGHRPPVQGGYAERTPRL